MLPAKGMHRGGESRTLPYVIAKAREHSMKRTTRALGAWVIGWCLLGSVAASTASASEPHRRGAIPSERLEADKFGDKLTMQVDRTKIDLKAHRLVVELSRPASRVEVKVFGEDKSILAEETVRPGEAAASEPIVIRWTQASDAAVARIEIYGYDQEDHWVGVAIIPWNVQIPHEEVHFESDKATILKPEIPKLQDSLTRINEAIERYRELGHIQLFIAGHTDTVGSPSYNLELSRRRAQAIAAWFVKNQVGIPVAFEGFGESSPLVETKDEVDEPRNRRVDYILSVEPPSGKSGKTPAWRYLNRAK